jgi:rare lipoprotein A
MCNFMPTQYHLRTLLVSGILVLVSACSSNYIAQSQSSGAATQPSATSAQTQAAVQASQSRYSIAQDKAPVVALAEHQIMETPARMEPLSLQGNKSPYTVNNKRYKILASAENYREEGLASWYGAKFHGHATSNGESFDMNKISAAHKSLPLPSWVRVTNLDNGRSIDVRINDRGPFHGGRIIDMSYAGAVKLGFQDKGTARVRVEAIAGSVLDSASYFVQVGAFNEKVGANAMRDKLSGELSDPVGVFRDNFYRVRIGPVTYSRASALQQQYANGEMGKPVIVAKP